MFIFDEIDEMPEGLLDTIIPFIDFHKEVDGLDFRKAIFLLIRYEPGANNVKVNTKFEIINVSVQYRVCIQINLTSHVQ